MKGVNDARASVTAPVRTVVTPAPVSSESPRASTTTMRNLLRATARNVSTRRDRSRRVDGITTNGAITGTRTRRRVNTTARTTSSHHSASEPMTTSTASRKRPNPGTDEVDSAVTATASECVEWTPVPAPTAVI